jgi:parvulin-like peptidyl-prolyl isomerase
MRKWTPIIMIVALVGFMLTIFLEWGMGLENVPGRRGQTVGKIGRDYVGIREFSQILERERHARRMQGQRMDDEGQLPMQVWESFVNETITSLIVQRLGLTATDEEVYLYLLNNPLPEFAQSEFFQTNGRFDMETYLAFINNPASWDNPAMVQIEQYVRNVLVPISKLNAIIESANNPSFSELEYEYRAQRERVSFEFLHLHPFAIDLSADALNDNALLAHYNANIADFATEEVVILNFVRFPKTPTSRDEEMIRRELRDIRASILAQYATFADEAAAESDDVGSARNGGELGWFGRGRMVGEFENVAFSTPEGDISQPFRTQFGYHIVMVDSIRREDGQITEVKARHILKNIMAGAETLDSIEALASSLLNSAESGENFADAAMRLSLALGTTLPFGRGETPSGIGNLSGLGHFVFDRDTRAGDVGELFETEDAFFVVQLQARIPAGTMPFEHVRARIRDIVSDSLRVQNSRSYLAEVAGRIGEMSFEEFAETNDILTAGSAQSITRRQFVPSVGRDNRTLAAAFRLPINTISSPIICDNGAFIIRVSERDAVRAMPADAPEIAVIRNQLRSEAARIAYQQWFEAMKRQIGVIENVREFYY